MSAEDHTERSRDCLSSFALDQLVAKDLGGSAYAAARAHLAVCARCSNRLARFAAVAPPPFQDLEANVPTEPKVIPRARAARYLRWVGPVTAGVTLVVAASAVVFVLNPRDSDSGATRVKGTVALGVIVRRESGETERLGQGDAVAPGDALRFEVAASRAGYVAVLGLDGAGYVSAYAPASGPMPSIAGGAPTVLPGSIVEDDTLGAERIVALLCAQPHPLDELRAAAGAALAKAGGDPSKVGDLGTGCAEAAFSIHKRRP